jgi:hypothetical protein
VDANVFDAATIGTVLSGRGAEPWLVGGSTSGGVAIWSANSPGGPWLPATFTTVSGDGPYDTITGLARSRGVTAAFGSHPSPIHGNPRPSPWTLADPGASWHEVPVLRELFGGENIISLGGLTGGEHGFFIAGTWIAASNRAVATVWRSTDGRSWVRNDGDANLAGVAGEITMADDVADGPGGIVAVGSALIPTPAAPTAQHGALWESSDGATWTRVGLHHPSLDAGAGQVQVERVQPLPLGWVAAGIRSVGGRSEAVVWTWGPNQQLSAERLPLPAPTPTGVVVTGLAVTSSSVIVAGAALGRPLLWTGRVGPGGRVGHWRPVTAPTATPPARLDAALVAAEGGTTLLALRGAGGSQLWETTLRANG